MLAQLPQTQTSQAPPAVEGDVFQAGLRRDLAGAPVILYGPTQGGAAKRAFDLVVALIVLPLWGLFVAMAALWLKTSTGTAFKSRTVVGYGGREFQLLALNARGLAGAAALANVLRGELSLVGPRVRSRAELDAAGPFRRAYLSARPGLVGVDPAGASGEEACGAYRRYALSWSATGDALMLFDALTSGAR